MGQNNDNSMQKREKVIVRTSIIGIAANLLLAGFKAFVGLTANSAAVISDAVNNLSDALSSIVTITGTKLAGKKPDKKHPLGYGRIEYMSALVVSAIVLYAGMTAFVDSVKKIITPGEVEYSVLSLVIIGTAVAVKIALGTYTGAKGREVNSGSLTASGKDALSDAILSSSVLAAALIFMFTGLNIEAWVGAVIALFIIKAGIEMISDAVSEMIGTRADTSLVKAIKSTARNVPGVHGAYDLVINNYGPDRNIASLHIEIDDHLSANEIDALCRRVQAEIFREHGVIISAVGIYPINTSDPEVVDMCDKIRGIVSAHEEVIQMHGFYADTQSKNISFDIIIDFSVNEREKLSDEIKKEISSLYPDYDTHITLDIDVSD